MMKNVKASLLPEVGKLLAVAALLLSALPLIWASSDGPFHDAVARTRSGALIGTTMTSRSGKTIFAFRGLRYAQPPVGQLRFKLPNPRSNPQRPVIVFIHQGGWFDLSGQSDIFGPQYLLDEDVVLVTINYRLGPLGFLSTGDSVSPGNYGLKDQALAFEWVRDNIASFGGDPNLVTIYGYSAGSASVQYHMVSPRSAGLFHRAISSSGSALSSWAINTDPKPLVRRLARLFDCPNDESATSSEMVECLRGKDADEIAKSYFSLTEWEFDPVVNFSPVIEAEGNSEQPFLTRDPLSAFKSGNFAQVPWITGSTDNEMMTRAAGILANNTLLDDFNRNFANVAPIAFYFERDPPESTRKSGILRQYYFGNNPITQDSLKEITDLYTDGVIFHGTDRSVKLASAVSTAPVYYYQFVYRGRYGFMPTEPGKDRPPGVVHNDDLLYIFRGEVGNFPFLESGMPETVVSQRMVKMLANFARTGNPTPNEGNNGDSLLPTRWVPHTAAGLECMEIGENLMMKRALRQDRAAVWDQIFPLTDGHSKA